MFGNYNLYRPIEAFYYDIYFYDSYMSTYPYLYMFGNMLSTITLKGGNITSSSSLYALLSFQLWEKVNIYDYTLEENDSIFEYTAQLLYVASVDIKNTTITNNKWSGTFTNALIVINCFDQGVINVDSLQIYDDSLAFRSGIHVSPLSGSAYITIVNSSFRNVTLNTGASLIKTNSVYSLLISN